MTDLHLALIRDHLAPLLHPESLWSYLWQPEDTQRVSDVLDEAYGYPVGSARWTLDWLSGPLFTFGEQSDRWAAGEGKAWILVVRRRGAEGSDGDNVVKAVYIQPKRADFRATTVYFRSVTIKAWQAADKKAKEVSWPRRLAEAEAELRAKRPELFHGKPALGGA